MCDHRTHDERACGVNALGLPKASEAAEYPILFSATVAGLLTWGPVKAGVSEVRRLLGSRAAALRCVEERSRGAGSAVQMRQEGVVDRDGEAPTGWRAVCEAMPLEWDERSDVLGERTLGERTAALRYVSRRRAEPEREEALAAEELPRRRYHPERKARQRPERVRWPEGAPSRPVRVPQLFN